MEIRESTSKITIILWMAFAARIAWVLIMPSLPVSDFGWYYDRALSILSGEGYSIDGRPTAQFPPGYPYFLALMLEMVETARGARLIQAVIGVFTCYLVYRLGRTVVSERIALMAATLTAIYPNYIFFNNLLASENLFIPLMLIGLLVLLDNRYEVDVKWRYGIAGLIFGLAALTRPAVLFFPVVFFAWHAIRQEDRQNRQGWGKALGLSALMAMAMIIVIVPWTLRNNTVFGSPVLISTNGGTVFWMANNAKADGNRYYPPGNPVERAPNELARNNIGYRLATEDIKSDPARFAEIIWLKYRRFFRAPDGLGWNIVYTKDHDWTKENLSSPFFIRPLYGLDKTHNHYRRVLAVGEYSLWIIAGIGMLIFARSHMRQQRTNALLFIFIYLYWFLFHLIFAFGHSRFMMPLAVFNLIFASTFFVSAFDEIKRRLTSWQPLLPGFFAAFAATIAVVFSGYWFLRAVVYLMPPPKNDMDLITAIIFGILIIGTTVTLSVQGRQKEPALIEEDKEEFKALITSPPSASEELSANLTS